MTFTILGYTLKIEKASLPLQEQGKKAKIEQTQRKLSQAIKEIEQENGSLSNYNITKKSGLSINTIKKYQSQNKGITKGITE